MFTSEISKMLSDNTIILYNLDFGYFTSLIHSFALTKNCDCLKENPLDLWEIFFYKFNSPPFFLSKILLLLWVFMSLSQCVLSNRGLCLPYPELPEWVSVLYIVKGINIHQYIHIYCISYIPWRKYLSPGSCSESGIEKKTRKLTQAVFVWPSLLKVQ